MTRRLYQLLFLILTICLGCSGDIVVAPLSDDGRLYNKLELNYHAVLLSVVAPYDTVRLVTTPRDMHGGAWKPEGLTSAQVDSILRSNPVKYVSQDSAKVVVDRDGLVRAVRTTATTGTVSVIATHRIGNITRADTTLVRVLNEPSPRKIAVFRVRPVDSLKVAMLRTLAIRVTALDSNNIVIPNVVTYVRTMDSLTVGVGGRRRTGWNTTTVTGNRVGETRVISEAYVYGILMTDTVLLEVGYPLMGGIEVVYRTNNIGKQGIDIGTVLGAVGPGATITWTNNSKTSPMSVLFDDPGAALPALVVSQNSGGGDMLDIPSDTSLAVAARMRFRRFLVPGTYPFRIQPFGLAGAVIVKDR